MAGQVSCWLACWLGLAKDLNYDMRNRTELNREIRLTSIMSVEDSSDLPRMLAVSDSKSMFDNLNREQYTGAEKRAAQEIAVIRDSLESMSGVPRWVPHERNVSDCLTKVKGNAASLIEFMKKGTYKLVGGKG